MKLEEMQEKLLLASEDLVKETKRIADTLETLVNMIDGVQPKELAEMAKKHKQERANARRKKK